MGVTSLILVIGTLIVWYRHRRQQERRENSADRDPKVTAKDKVKMSRTENNNSIQNGSVKASSGSDSPVKSRIPVRAKVKQS